MNTDAEYMAAQVERLRRLFAPLRGLSEDTERLEKIVLACDRLTEVGVSKLPERLYSMTDPDQGLDVLLEIGVVNNILQVHPESTVDYEPEGKGPQPPDFKVAFSDRPIFLEVKRIRQLSLEAIREKLRRACREQLSGEPARQRVGTFNPSSNGLPTTIGLMKMGGSISGRIPSVP